MVCGLSSCDQSLGQLPVSTTREEAAADIAVDVCAISLMRLVFRIVSVAALLEASNVILAVRLLSTPWARTVSTTREEAAADIAVDVCAISLLRLVLKMVSVFGATSHLLPQPFLLRRLLCYW